jgi:hypothetical protein
MMMTTMTMEGGRPVLRRRVEHRQLKHHSRQRLKHDLYALENTEELSGAEGTWWPCWFACELTVRLESWSEEDSSQEGVLREPRFFSNELDDNHLQGQGDAKYDERSHTVPCLRAEKQQDCQHEVTHQVRVGQRQREGNTLVSEFSGVMLLLFNCRDLLR